jgi:sarcosine oxidase subunit gamma
MAAPTPDLRRPPLKRPLDASTTTGLRSQADARELALVDLSALPRIGFKGRGTVDAMRRRGIALEPQANHAFLQGDGSLCLVLAASEVLMLSNLAGDGARFGEWDREFRLEDEERTYPLPRRDSHFWIAVSGRRAPEMFAKLCAIDLRLIKFPNLALTQTSVAKMTGIVVRWDRGTTPVFHLLADIASALYFSTCLIDAAREFGGAFIGLEQFEGLDTDDGKIG